jgi:hypothetical protein
MATAQSFDVTSGCDLQEVDNAVNQAIKEIRQRFDFKGVQVSVELQRDDNAIVLTAPDEMHLKAAWEVVLGRLARRGVPTKNIQPKPIETAPGGSARLQVTLQQGIPTETAHAIVKFVKQHKLKKVQVAIQADQVRVSSPSRDELQQVIGLLRGEDFGIELSFGNFRSS